MTTVLSYGLGVDSTAILLRWLEMTDEERGFALDDLVVITAQTGSEYPETIRLVETHIFPLFRENDIRFVEIAKAGPEKADGYKVLQDTREPVALHPDGGYRLIDEMRDSGTIPQYGGIRKCSLKFKGEPIDAWLDDHLLTWNFTHVMGYEKDEKGRAQKDAREGATNAKLGARRTPSYPLIEWGWNRARCLDYIAEVTGASWAKSACTFCPFAEDRGLGRLSCGSAVETMKLEAVAVALNPRQTLFPEHKGLRGKHKGRPMPGSAIETFEIHFPEAYEAYVTDICDGDWTCYEVKRTWTGVGKDKPAKDGKPAKPGKAGVGGVFTRSLRRLHTGTAASCHMVLRERAQLRGIEVTTDEYGFRVADVSGKPEFGDGIEHRIAVAPAGAQDKVNKRFAGIEAKILTAAA